jgi:hypothetical protein
MPPKSLLTIQKSTGRAENRRNRSSILEKSQDIKDTREGRKFLEEHSLLCPPGEPATPSALSICLHQISLMSGISKTAINAIRSIVFMMEEMEEITINETIKDAFKSQVTEFTSEIKLLIEDAKEKIDSHIKSITIPINTQSHNQAQQNRATGGTYAAALINPPSTVNPILAAREGIKARQILLEGIKESTLSRLDTFQLKKELNKILEEAGLDNGRIRSVQNQRDGKTLIEMDNDAAATWIKTQANTDKFCSKIGTKISIKLRQYNIIAFNVPTDMDAENPRHKTEIVETNSLNEDDIVTIQWAKPVARRNPGQRTAHLIITMTDADTANRAIAKGMYICYKNCRVERVKKEPPRCLKCQGWNHFTKDCTFKTNVCGNCSNNHRTSKCLTPQAKRCASCKSSDHASWDRGCPEFVKRLSDFNKRNPEKSLHFFPTTETWTWSASENNVKSTISRPSENTRYEPLGRPPRPAAMARKMDTYIPECDGSRRPNETNREARWGDRPQSPPPFNEQTIREANKNLPSPQRPTSNQLSMNGDNQPARERVTQTPMIRILQINLNKSEKRTSS